MHPIEHDEQQVRAQAVGALIRDGRLADLTPEVLGWYVERAEFHERQLARLRMRAAEALDEVNGHMQRRRELDARAGVVPIPAG